MEELLNSVMLEETQSNLCFEKTIVLAAMGRLDWTRVEAVIHVREDVTKDQGGG